MKTWELDAGLPAMKRVGFVACGLMGLGIAEAGACAGLGVLVVESTSGDVAAGERRTHTSLQRRVRLRRPNVGAGASAKRSIDPAGLANRQLVLEANTESATDEVDVVAAVDKIVEQPGGLLCTAEAGLLRRKSERGFYQF